MAEKITPHTHCHVCMKPIPLGETLCSEDCKQKYQEMIKKNRKTRYFLYIALIAMIAAIIIFNQIY